MKLDNISVQIVPLILLSTLFLVSCKSNSTSMTLADPQQSDSTHVYPSVTFLQKLKISAQKTYSNLGEAKGEMETFVYTAESVSTSRRNVRRDAVTDRFNLINTELTQLVEMLVELTARGAIEGTEHIEVLRSTIESIKSRIRQIRDRAEIIHDDIEALVDEATISILANPNYNVDNNSTFASLKTSLQQLRTAIGSSNGEGGLIEEIQLLIERNPSSGGQGNSQLEPGAVWDNNARGYVWMYLRQTARYPDIERQCAALNAEPGPAYRGEWHIPDVTELQSKWQWVKESVLENSSTPVLVVKDAAQSYFDYKYQQFDLDRGYAERANSNRDYKSLCVRKYLRTGHQGTPGDFIVPNPGAGSTTPGSGSATNPDSIAPEDPTSSGDTNPSEPTRRTVNDSKTWTGEIFGATFKFEWVDFKTSSFEVAKRTCQLVSGWSPGFTGSTEQAIRHHPSRTTIVINGYENWATDGPVKAGFANARECYWEAQEQKSRRLPPAYNGDRFVYTPDLSDIARPLMTNEYCEDGEPAYVFCAKQL